LDRLELRGSQRSVALQVVPDELRRLAGDVVPVSVVGRCGLMATALGERVEPRRLPQPIYLIREPIDLMNEAKIIALSSAMARTKSSLVTLLASKRSFSRSS
jgi:hypothetical protein